MLCCELFSLLTFHVFKGSLEAISVFIVSHSSCSTSAELSVSANAHFLMDEHRLGEKV